MIPHQNPQDLERRFLPLIEYLNRELGIPCVLISVSDYQEILDKFHNGGLDLVRFGGFTYVKAFVRDKADPLVMRDVDSHFVSYFLSRKNDTTLSLEDYRGRKFAFGPLLSTSGHLMPRYFLARKNILPEQFFSQVLYSEGHDTTAEWVKSGRVDLGVANAVVINKLFQNGVIKPSEIRIVWRTPPFTNYVWAARNDLPASLKDRIIDAFLKLTYADPGHRKILNEVGARAYFPATFDDFAALLRIAVELDLIDHPAE